MFPIGRILLSSEMILLSFTACAVLVLLGGHVEALEIHEECVTPNSSQGTCIEVRNCTPVLDQLKAEPSPLAKLEYLRKSQCGFRDRKPLVCCPQQNSELKLRAAEIVEELSEHRNLPLLSNDICGPLSDDRIVRGRRVKLNELPWMALIAYSESGSNRSIFRCGGTIINDLYILTAAHCVKYLKPGIRPVYVRVGENDLDKTIDCDEELIHGTKTCSPEPQDIPIAQVFAHPEHTEDSDLRNDIALIRLTRQIDFSPDSVRPVCLPTILSLQEKDLEGNRLTVAGWGVTENGTSSRVLLKVGVPIKPVAECKQVYKNQVQISETSQLCAGGEKDGGQSCNGDSGGPLTYYGRMEGSVRIIQYGIVSYGPQTCGTGLPAVYTRVGYYMNWILDNISP